MFWACQGYRLSSVQVPVLSGCGAVLSGCGAVISGCGAVISGCGAVLSGCGEQSLVGVVSSAEWVW